VNEKVVGQEFRFFYERKPRIRQTQGKKVLHQQDTFFE